MSAHTPVECDCLNWCGDDPWLKDGRSTPCGNLLKRQADDRKSERKHAEISDLCKVYGAATHYDLIVKMHNAIKALRPSKIGSGKP